MFSLQELVAVPPNQDLTMTDNTEIIGPVMVCVYITVRDNHTEVYNIIRMQMTPKIITIRYIKRYKTLATLKFSTAAYRVVVSTDHIRLNAWPSNYLFTA